MSEEEEGEGDEASSEEEEKEVGGASMGGASLLEPIEDSTDVPILPLTNNNNDDDDDDVDKGKAVKDQLGKRLIICHFMIKFPLLVPPTSSSTVGWVIGRTYQTSNMLKSLESAASK